MPASVGVGQAEDRRASPSTLRDQRREHPSQAGPGGEEDVVAERVDRRAADDGRAAGVLVDDGQLPEVDGDDQHDGSTSISSSSGLG